MVTLLRRKPDVLPRPVHAVYLLARDLNRSRTGEGEYYLLHVSTRGILNVDSIPISTMLSRRSLLNARIPHLRCAIYLSQIGSQPCAIASSVAVSP